MREYGKIFGLTVLITLSTAGCAEGNSSGTAIPTDPTRRPATMLPAADVFPTIIVPSPSRSVSSTPIPTAGSDPSRMKTPIPKKLPTGERTSAPTRTPTHRPTITPLFRSPESSEANISQVHALLRKYCADYGCNEEKLWRQISFPKSKIQGKDGSSKLITVEPDPDTLLMKVTIAPDAFNSASKAPFDEAFFLSDADRRGYHSNNKVLLNLLGLPDPPAGNVAIYSYGFVLYIRVDDAVNYQRVIDVKKFDTIEKAFARAFTINRNTESLNLYDKKDQVTVRFLQKLYNLSGNDFNMMAQLLHSTASNPFVVMNPVLTRLLPPEPLEQIRGYFILSDILERIQYPEGKKGRIDSADEAFDEWLFLYFGQKRSLLENSAASKLMKEGLVYPVKLVRNDGEVTQSRYLIFGDRHRLEKDANITASSRKRYRFNERL